jgi:DeoR/GlpR family transcriptional regulator of sugar metabolism
VDAVNAEERRVAVLRAIVADFVATNEPVGSKALVERHNLGVSSATVRNDMAALEEEGYIAQPHTSAGRSRSSSRARSTSTTCSSAACACSHSSPARSRSCSTRR